MELTLQLVQTGTITFGYQLRCSCNHHLILNLLSSILDANFHTIVQIEVEVNSTKH
ncbi:hypothetical protein WICANDRAFT_87663 [Wickerhamomyces anomalus NRRL Y-366-8]|uniref:Uncharacterized protein n=1 Tax=Wickerhamomyces anomalus (strain ATCC 58044 / CBS 1984 / NCYC 433 / NRRL Y-366-8) TaxID=683960 RepID=A0A1E3PA71_WICAA|nr:uncharacterized protein WICANDRAFT_87663 [Wickerhamomyces anomalus NRRL Y-366-8]ODQ62291.1 hypothetical protein WICANDRAFT_87663 [Wickerhamomyces anomalus NRRL Y-366-8]